MKLIKWLLSITFTGLALALLTALLAVMQMPIKPQLTSKSPANRQIEAIVSQLAMCESGGNADAVHYNDGAVGLHSRGLLQFQRPTFKGYWTHLINPDVDDADVDNLWTDPDNQKILATAMLEKDLGNLRHWKICSSQLVAQK